MNYFLWLRFISKVRQDYFATIWNERSVGQHRVVEYFIVAVHVTNAISIARFRNRWFNEPVYTVSFDLLLTLHDETSYDTHLSKSCWKSNTK